MATFNVGHIRQLVVRSNSTGCEFLDDNMGAGIGGGPTITVSSVSVAVTESYYAVIQWQTSTATTSKVQYGIGNYNSSDETAGTRTAHSQVINILTPNSLYQFRITDIAGSFTFTPASNTFTSRRLELPRFGPFASAAQAFEDAASDFNGGANPSSTIGSPVACDVFANDNTDYAATDGNDIYVRCDYFGMQFDCYLRAHGLPGAGAADPNTGGAGGGGHNGGGGGGADTAANGGAGGNTAAGANGADGESTGTGTGGPGGAGIASTDTYSYGVNPAAGGDGGGATAGAGSGGGGSGGRIVVCGNDGTAHAGSSGFTVEGGGAGTPFIGIAADGIQGGEGSVSMFMRKWPGITPSALPASSEIYRVSGTQTAGWVITAASFSDVWDHLNQP